MYRFSISNVKGIIVGSGRLWITFISTPCGLRQAGDIYRSRRAALAAVGAI